MINLYRYQIRFLLGLILTIIMSLGPITASKAESQDLTNVNFQRRPSYKVDAIIMEIDVNRNILVVAEKEVHLINRMIDEDTFGTRLLDEDSNPVAFSAFEVGQRVLVRGYKLQGDRVAAVLIQHRQSSRTHRNTRFILRSSEEQGRRGFRGDED